MSTLLSIDAAALRQPALFPLSVSAHTHSSLGLVGNWQALFAVLCGELPVPRGALRINDRDGRASVIAGQLGVMPSRFSWPQGHTVSQVLELSARLLGLDAGASAKEAERVLAVLGLSAQSKQRLQRLLPMQLRLVALAHALLGSPRTLALEEPFLGLTTQDSNVVWEAIEVARGNCQLIVAVSHADPGSVERLLIDHCAEVLVLRNGALTLQGPPTRLGDGGGLFAVTLAGDAGHLREALASAGVLVRSFSPLSPEAAGAFSGQSVGRLVVELPPGQSTLPLFAAAKSSGTTLLELRALGDVE